MVLLGSSLVKVSSNVVEEFCRDIALILVIIQNSITFYTLTRSRSEKRHQTLTFPFPINDGITKFFG